MNGNEDDPNNVRPTVPKGQTEEKGPSRENLTMKRASRDGGGGCPRGRTSSKDRMSSTKVSLSPGPKTPGVEPPARSPSPLHEHPLLKLNEYAKNCSQADSADSNCDFVKKVVYNSDAVSSVSTTVDPGSKKPQTGKQQQQSVQRSGPTAVVLAGRGGGGGQGAAASGSKEKKERPTKREGGAKKEGEGGGASLKKTELESAKGHSKERNNNKHANKEHKRASKTDKGGKRRKKK